MPEKGNELLKRLYLQSGNCADRVSYWPVSPISSTRTEKHTLAQGCNLPCGLLSRPPGTSAEGPCQLERGVSRIDCSSNAAPR